MVVAFILGRAVGKCAMADALATFEPSFWAGPHSTVDAIFRPSSKNGQFINKVSLTRNTDGQIYDLEERYTECFLGCATEA